MKTEIDRLFGQHMQPLTPAARKLAYTFAHWLIAELRELGVKTEGFGPVHPHWRLAIFPEGKAMLQRELNQEQLLKLLARVFFYGKPRSLADFELCQLIAQISFTYGLIGHQQ